MQERMFHHLQHLQPRFYIDIKMSFVCLHRLKSFLDGPHVSLRDGDAHINLLLACHLSLLLSGGLRPASILERFGRELGNR